MRVHSLCQRIFLLSLLFVLCSADDRTFQVVGSGHCADCADNKFTPSQAFSGLHVTIDCKLKNGDMKRLAAGALNDKGEFNVPLPQDVVVDQGRDLKHDCYAQLHSAAAIPCPTHSKIEFKSLDENGKLYSFAPNKNLQFSAALCTSKFLWPYFKFPPLPKTHPWLKNFGHPWNLPPLHKPLFPPIYKHPIVKPLHPPVPANQPPVVKPHPHHVPTYRPPVVEPHPPRVPIYKPPKKPYPPKPNPPVHKPPKKPCPPKLKPPVVKPLVPIYKPPFFKKPCPPLPQLPPLPKLPPFPKIPPKSFFKHPKFGGWPPLIPAIPQP